MSNWIEIGPLEDIPVLGSRVIRTVDGDIAVFRAADNSVFAIEDSCPHKGGPLSQGIVHGHRVTCPLHNWVIELESGSAVEPDVGCVKKFPVRNKDGLISVDLESLFDSGVAAE